MRGGRQRYSGQSVGHVEVLSGDVVDAVREAVHPELKSEDTWGQTVKLFICEEGDKGLVVCLNPDRHSQDVIREFLTGPGNREGLFLDLNLTTLVLCH